MNRAPLLHTLESKQVVSCSWRHEQHIPPGPVYDDYCCTPGVGRRHGKVPHHPGQHGRHCYRDDHFVTATAAHRAPCRITLRPAGSVRRRETHQGPRLRQTRRPEWRGRASGAAGGVPSPGAPFRHFASSVNVFLLMINLLSLGRVSHCQPGTVAWGVRSVDSTFASRLTNNTTGASQQLVLSRGHAKRHRNTSTRCHARKNDPRFDAWRSMYV